MKELSLDEKIDQLKSLLRTKKKEKTQPPSIVTEEIEERPAAKNDDLEEGLYANFSFPISPIASKAFRCPNCSSLFSWLSEYAGTELPRWGCYCEECKAMDVSDNMQKADKYVHIEATGVLYEIEYGEGSVPAGIGKAVDRFKPLPPAPVKRIEQKPMPIAEQAPKVVPNILTLVRRKQTGKDLTPFYEATGFPRRKGIYNQRFDVDRVAEINTRIYYKIPVTREEQKLCKAYAKRANNLGEQVGKNCPVCAEPFYYCSDVCGDWLFGSICIACGKKDCSDEAQYADKEAHGHFFDETRSHLLAVLTEIVAQKKAQQRRV